MKKTNVLLTMVASLVLVVSCGPQGYQEPTPVVPDSQSGGDDVTAGARGVFGEPVSDSLDATTGDNTDLKYVDIDARGDLGVSVTFHTAQVAGSVALLNESSDVLVEETVASGTSTVEISDFPVMPGRYYVRIRADEGKSDYVIERQFERDTTYLSEADIAWRDEQIAHAHDLQDRGMWAEAREVLLAVKQRFPDNEMVAEMIDREIVVLEEAEEAARLAAEREEEERRRRRRHHRDREQETETETTTETTTETETETETETDVAVAEPEVEETSISASIVTVRDRGASAGTTLILTGCGTSSGLSEGATGRITGTSHRATISRITGSTSCEAESSATAGQIGTANRVSF